MYIDTGCPKIQQFPDLRPSSWDYAHATIKMDVLQLSGLLTVT
jgi:hypothetical protein